MICAGLDMPNQGAPKPVRSNRLYETISFFLYIPGSNCQAKISQSPRDKVFCFKRVPVLASALDKPDERDLAPIVLLEGVGS